MFSTCQEYIIAIMHIFVPPFNLFYNIKFPIGMQLVLGIRELLCDHCTLFFFLSLMLRQPCTRRGGGNIFPPGEKKIPTWGLSFYKKELSCDQIQNHACIAPIYFFVVMWLVYRVCTNNFIPMGANSYGWKFVCVCVMNFIHE